MTEASVKKEVDRVLTEQVKKGIRKWEIALSLFYVGFSERQVGRVMSIDAKTTHSYKIDFKNNKKRREVKNYLLLDAVKKQEFIKHVKVLVGEPFNPIEKKR